jgi:AbrB family looped-hinge helix DNA binding protein
MSLIKVRRAAQITLPNDIRKALNVNEGDYLEVKIVAEGVLLKPVTVVDKATAWRAIAKAMSTVQPTPEQAAKPIEEQEQEIMAEVKAARRDYAKERRRR